MNSHGNLRSHSASYLILCPLLANYAPDSSHSNKYAVIIAKKCIVQILTKHVLKKQVSFLALALFCNLFNKSLTNVLVKSNLEMNDGCTVYLECKEPLPCGWSTCQTKFYTGNQVPTNAWKAFSKINSFFIAL